MGASGLALTVLSPHDNIQDQSTRCYSTIQSNLKLVERGMLDQCLNNLVEHTLITPPF